MESHLKRDRGSISGLGLIISELSMIIPPNPNWLFRKGIISTESRGIKGRPPAPFKLYKFFNVSVRDEPSGKYLVVVTESQRLRLQSSLVSQ